MSSSSKFKLSNGSDKKKKSSKSAKPKPSPSASSLSHKQHEKRRRDQTKLIIHQLRLLIGGSDEWSTCEILQQTKLKLLNFINNNNTTNHTNNKNNNNNNFNTHNNNSISKEESTNNNRNNNDININDLDSNYNLDNKFNDSDNNKIYDYLNNNSDNSKDVDSSTTPNENENSFGLPSPRGAPAFPFTDSFPFQPFDNEHPDSLSLSPLTKKSRLIDFQSDMPHSTNASKGLISDMGHYSHYQSSITEEESQMNSANNKMDSLLFRMVGSSLSMNNELNNNLNISNVDNILHAMGNNLDKWLGCSVSLPMSISNGISLCRTDLQGRILEVNQQFQIMTGFHSSILKNSKSFFAPLFSSISLVPSSNYLNKISSEIRNNTNSIYYNTSSPSTIDTECNEIQLGNEQECNLLKLDMESPTLFPLIEKSGSSFFSDLELYLSDPSIKPRSFDFSHEKNHNNSDNNTANLNIGLNKLSSESSKIILAYRINSDNNNFVPNKHPYSMPLSSLFDIPYKKFLTIYPFLCSCHNPAKINKFAKTRDYFHSKLIELSLRGEQVPYFAHFHTAHPNQFLQCIQSKKIGMDTDGRVYMTFYSLPDGRRYVNSSYYQ